MPDSEWSPDPAWSPEPATDPTIPTIIAVPGRIEVKNVTKADRDQMQDAHRDMIKAIAAYFLRLAEVQRA